MPSLATRHSLCKEVMSTFDRDVWLLRARKKLESRATKRPSSIDALADEYAEEIDSIEMIDAVVGWCTSKGIDVVFRKHHGDWYDSDKKTVEINCKASIKRQLHAMLHECGHHLIGSATNNVYANGWPKAFDHRVKRTKKHKIDVLEEEFEAWKRGERLAKKLGLKLDVRSYNETRVRSLSTYVRWAADKK